MVRVAPSGQMRALYISDEAWQRLASMALDAQYVTRTDAPRGIGAYIEWLMASCTFEDARPLEVREQDESMLEAGYAPEWRMYGPRRKRNVKLTVEALALASVEAMTLGLAYPPVRRMIGAPTYLDTEQCMSAILEALGTEWLALELKQNDQP